jgi:hypothetical protein
MRSLTTILSQHAFKVALVDLNNPVVKRSSLANADVDPTYSGSGRRSLVGRGSLSAENKFIYTAETEPSKLRLKKSASELVEEDEEKKWTFKKSQRPLGGFAASRGLGYSTSDTAAILAKQAREHNERYESREQ